jgi:hypothetical protein
VIRLARGTPVATAVQFSEPTAGPSLCTHQGGAGPAPEIQEINGFLAKRKNEKPFFSPATPQPLSSSPPFLRANNESVKVGAERPICHSSVFQKMVQRAKSAPEQKQLHKKNRA